MVALRFFLISKRWLKFNGVTFYMEKKLYVRKRKKSMVSEIIDPKHVYVKFRKMD